MSVKSTERLSAESFAKAENVSRETLARLRAFLTLLEQWQLKINLVSCSTLNDPWRQHVLDAAQLAPLIQGETVVDLGSGAGIPGLLLAILRRELNIHLIESDARKCAFLREAARVTGATPQIHNVRIETIDSFSADTVVARALAPLPRLLALATRFSPQVCVFPKGQTVERELTESRKKWRFEVERVASRSDPRGVILRLREIQYAGADIRYSQPERRGR